LLDLLAAVFAVSSYQVEEISMQFSPLDAGGASASFFWFAGCLVPLGIGAILTWLGLAFFGKSNVDNTDKLTEVQGLLGGRDRELRDRETELGNMRTQMKNLEGEYGSLKSS
jgi:hypothetical protein